MGNASSVAFADKELATASEKGNLPRVRFLIEKDGANVNFTDEYGWSPVLHAASEGHLDVIKYLISKGATLTQVTSDKATILHLAVSSSNESVLSFLLQYGACDVNACNEGGWTPLHLACLGNQTGLAKLLLSHQADKSVTNNEGKSASEIATSNALRTLIKEGPSPKISRLEQEEEIASQNNNSSSNNNNNGMQKSLQKLQNLQVQPRTPVEMKGYTYLGDMHDSSEDLPGIATNGFYDNSDNNDSSDNNDNNNSNNSEASSSTGRSLTSNNNNNNSSSNNNTNDNNDKLKTRGTALIEREYKRIFDAIHVLRGIDPDDLNLIQMDELIEFHQSEMQKYVQAKKILEEIRQRELDLLMK